MSGELANLVRIGRLIPFTPAAKGLIDLRRSGRTRLRDAANSALAFESRFDLAYNGAFSLALAALHASGHKPADRIDAINALAHTTRLSLGDRRVILRAHTLRNQMEYEGERMDDERLVNDLIAAGHRLSEILPDP